MTPAEQAAEAIDAQLGALRADKYVKYGTSRWFEMQALGFGLSMLRRMIKAGAHLDQNKAMAFRKALKAEE